MWDAIRDWALRELSEVKRAPVAFVITLALGVAIGIYAMRTFYSERFAVMESRISALQESQGRSTEVSADSGSVIQQWSGGSTETCYALISGTTLLKAFTQDYNAILVCGVNRVNTDRLADTAITVSKPFGIDSTFTIQMPVSTAMRESILASTKGLPRPPVPQGTKLAAQVALWYEVAVIPKGVDVTNIRSLIDIEKLGGKRLPDDERKGSLIQIVLE